MVSEKVVNKVICSAKIQRVKNKKYFVYYMKTFVSFSTFSYESFDSITLCYSCLPRSQKCNPKSDLVTVRN